MTGNNSAPVLEHRGATTEGDQTLSAIQATGDLTLLARDPAALDRAADPASFIIQALERSKAWLGEVLAVDAYSKFKVGVAAGRPIESDINRIVLSLGLKVTRQRGHGCVTAVGALTNVYTKYGPRSLVSTLFTLREAFGDYGYESTVIQGLALFGERYAGRVDERRLLEKLASKPKGVKGLINHAHLIREKVAQPVVPCIAAAITDTYNAGARGKGLGSFWKDHADTADAA